MNIICDKTLLSAAIDGVSKAVTLRSTIPVLEGILLKAEGFQLTLTGYDLEMGIVTTIEANVKEPGEIVLNAKLLSSMISRMPSGQITIQSADNGKTTIPGPARPSGWWAFHYPPTGRGSGPTASRCSCFLRVLRSEKSRQGP